MRQEIQAEISQLGACAESYFFISFWNNDPVGRESFASSLDRPH